MYLGLHPHLQMRTGGVWSREMARRRLLSGPQTGRILLWSQTLTSPDTLSPLVSEAAKPHGSLVASLSHTLNTLTQPNVCLPAKFLGNQVLSYGQNLSFSFRVDRRDTRLSAEDLVLEGAGLRVSVPLIAQGNSYPSETTVKYIFRWDSSLSTQAWAARKRKLFSVGLFWSELIWPQDVC